MFNRKFPIFKPWLSAVLLAVMAFFFFVGGTDGHTPRSLEQLWNLGHIAFFALFTCQLLYLRRFRQAGYLRQVPAALAAALVLGLGIEWIQAGIGRMVDAQDIYKNVLGALVGAAFLLPARKQIRRRALAGFQGAALILAGVTAWPLLAAGVDEYRASRDFPLLAGFETRWELSRWSGKARHSIVHVPASQGHGALGVDLDTTTYSGVALDYFPQDWSGYGYLSLEVFNPDDTPIRLTCRIHDQRHSEGSQHYHDRFNRRFTIAPGWHTIRIDLNQVAQAPRDRTMDLRRIRNLGIFATRLPHPRRIYLDEVQLLR